MGPPTTSVAGKRRRRVGQRARAGAERDVVGVAGIGACSSMPRPQREEAGAPLVGLHVARARHAGERHGSAPVADVGGGGRQGAVVGGQGPATAAAGVRSRAALDGRRRGAATGPSVHHFD